MEEQLDVSVVICTYNRCEMLLEALESVLAQQTGGVRYEVIVVDNNSTDQTRQVIESFMARGHANLRYLFEGEQGLSHARNTGIRSARAPVIAFTDDDVHVAPDWVASIKRALDAHPEVDYVGGKVLPRWPSEPPSWLTRWHWSPLSIMDYGEYEDGFYVNASKQICLVGANLACRREVFERIGFFTPEFQRYKDSIGSTEDHELQLRLWGAGGQGRYVPDLVVTAEVQPERLTKAYHRRWHTGHGASCAMMRLVERIDTRNNPDGRLVAEPPDLVTLFGSPSYLYSDVLHHCIGWLRATVHRDEERSLQHELRIWWSLSYIRKTYELTAAERKHSHLAEVRAFVQGLLRQKVRAASLRSREGVSSAKT